MCLRLGDPVCAALKLRVSIDLVLGLTYDPNQEAQLLEQVKRLERTANEMRTNGLPEYAAPGLQFYQLAESQVMVRLPDPGAAATVSNVSMEPNSREDGATLVDP